MGLYQIAILCQLSLSIKFKDALEVDNDKCVAKP